MSFDSSFGFANLLTGNKDVTTHMTRNIIAAGILFTTSGLLLAAELPPPPPAPPNLPAPSRPLGTPPPAFPTPIPGSAPVLAPLPAMPLATNLPSAGTNLGPKIAFATPVYDFGRAKSGDPVKYTYVFTNIGDSLLELSNVQPQCGCTATGEWTRKVEPGQTGKIPIQFNSASYSGQIFKTITVSCNDRATPMTVLQLKGTIWKPIEFIPPYTVINIPPDATNASTVVRIVNNTEEPLTLTNLECSLTNFTADLKATQPGKEFQLTLTAIPPLRPGSLSGKVSLKTSSTNMASLDIPFWANVQAAVMVLPPQIMLPAGPLTTAVTPSITVQNNTTNKLAVSDPSINLPGINVQLKEMQPGRLFNLQLSFPPGFELPKDQKTLLTFKSNHPQFATLEVPVLQIQRPPSVVPTPLPAAVPPKPPVGGPPAGGPPPGGPPLVRPTAVTLPPLPAPPAGNASTGH